MLKKLMTLCIGLMSMLLIAGCDAVEIVGLSFDFVGDILSIVE